jgi:ribosome biogenesis GTPase A
MPPKGKKNKGDDEDLGLMKAARFGRVKNTVRSLWFRRLYQNHFVIAIILSLLWQKIFNQFSPFQRILHFLIKLSMGFVGLPNVGKSSLTNILCGSMHAEAANYP